MSRTCGAGSRWGAGQGTGLSPWPVNGKAGAESITLTSSQIPSHHHTISTNIGPYATNAASFTNTRWRLPLTCPATRADVTDHGDELRRLWTGRRRNERRHHGAESAGRDGRDQAHENRQPVLAVRFAINATDGVYPDYN